MICHHASKFGGYRFGGSGDIILLIRHVILQHQVA